MNGRRILALGIALAVTGVAGCAPAGMVAPFYRAECPNGWVEADGRQHKLKMHGRTVLGVGRYAQGGGNITLGESGGSHRMRVSVLENQNAPKKGDNSVEGVRVEWEDEGRAESRAIEDTGMWRAGPWTEHFPPYVGLLYCVKKSSLW
jgi:hypothetical protein